jgi:hypothetical protein
MSIKSKLLGVFGLGAACAICCAPLIAPLLFGAGTLGLGTSFGLGLLGLSLDQMICAGLAAAALTGVGFWLRRKQKNAKPAKSCECETACDTKTCAPAKLA